MLRYGSRELTYYVKWIEGRDLHYNIYLASMAAPRSLVLAVPSAVQCGECTHRCVWPTTVPEQQH